MENFNGDATFNLINQLDSFLAKLAIDLLIHLCWYAFI